MFYQFLIAKHVKPATTRMIKNAAHVDTSNNLNNPYNINAKYAIIENIINAFTIFIPL